MDSKDINRQFRAATWANPTEIETFVAEVGVAEVSDLIKLLDALTDRILTADNAAHRRRCAVFARLAAPVADRELFVPYLRSLKRGDATVRSVLAPLLNRVNNVAGHAELVSLMTSPDSDLRATVAPLLKKLGGRLVFEELFALVRRGDASNPTDVMDLLVTIAGHFAIPALAAVLASPKSKDRVAAARLLGDRARMARDLPAATLALVAVLSDADEHVMEEAVRALSALCQEDAFWSFVEPLLDSPRAPAVVAVIRALVGYRSHRVYALLASKFREGPKVVRLAVLDTCEALAADEVVPVLVEALGHRQLPVRQRASNILAQFSRAGTVELARTILWLLRSRDVNVRRLAVDMARHVHDREAQLWPKLIRYLRDEDWWVRERVTDALIEIAGPELSRHLMAMLEDPSDVIRRYAVDALVRLKDPAAIAPLIRIAEGDSDWWVRERAIAGIAEMQATQALPQLLALLAREAPIRCAILEALSHMKAAAAAPHVAALLDEPDVELKLAVLACLETIGDAALASRLQPYTDHSDVRLREASRKLLSAWNLTSVATTLQTTERGISLLDRMLCALAQREGDDLILSTNRKPYMRKLGATTPLANNVFSQAQIDALILPCLTPAQRQEMDTLHDVDFSYSVAGYGHRFRVNVFRQHTGLSAVFRRIGSALIGLDALGLPPVVKTLGDLKNGLVLVGGPTGSGKSTTLAALIDYINESSDRHIVTIEDPIEAIHVRKKGLVNQREVGTHTRSFHAALRGALRQDPDVLLVGEMRDLETIRFAVTAAETGHLVFGTIHTVSADTSIDRMINAFPPDEQPQVRSQLADSLRAVVCQNLLSRKEGGRALAVEVMLNTDAIASLIRKGKTFQIPAVVTTAKDVGMQSMDWDLERLVRAGVVPAEQAYAKAHDKKPFEALLAGNEPKETRAVPTPPPARGQGRPA